ncbi:MAG: tyrosine-type recombinase/integrase [Acidimicrobiales bacterium]
MGYVQKLPQGYRARWRDPSGRLHSKSFGRLREAEQFLRKQEVAVDRGSFVDERAGRVTFGEWAEHYLATAGKRLARTSYARDVDYLNNHVLPRWERVPLGKITKSAVERWVADLSEPGARASGEGTLAPGTIEKIYQTFRKIMAAAVEDDRIPKLPCPAHPPLPRGKRKPVRFLTEAQVSALAAAIDPRYEAAIYLLAYGGFRIGELAALRVSDVDWDRHCVRVERGLTDVGGVIAFEDVKTARSLRSVPMADLALEKLRVHIDAYVAADDEDALLFPGSRGAPLRPNNWRKRDFGPAVEQSGLVPLSPHDLRHTAASFLIAEGANPWMLAEILGHRDTRMIDLVYGHLFERDREALRQRMSRRARDGSNGNEHRLVRT